MKEKFKIVKMKNGRCYIQRKVWFWWEDVHREIYGTSIGRAEFYDEKEAKEAIAKHLSDLEGEKSIETVYL